MMIHHVRINELKKRIEIDTPMGELSLNYSKLRLCPTDNDRIIHIYVDPELKNNGVTYKLASGKEESVHIAAFDG